MQLLPDNTYLADPALRSYLGSRLDPAVLEWAEPQLIEIGRAAPAELRRWGEECEASPPRLRTIEPWGERVDEVVYSEAWWKLKARAAAAGCVALPYERQSLNVAGPQTRVVQAALAYLFEPGTATYFCPVAMTDAAASVLIESGADRLRDEVLPHLVSREPDQAWTAGQWMTEQQGGSDVGANAVEARPEAGGWRLYGRKFFCSNVGGEVVLALARPQSAGPGTAGLGLFLIPRLLADGTRNHYRIDRLKDKLGTRAMATGEVTLEGAHAELIGDLERGFAQMTPMLNITRVHNAISSAAGMRRGLMLACAYAAQRSAFGKRLDQHPLQRVVLTELAVAAEGCLHLTMRMAELLGRLECGSATDSERLLFRLGTSIAKLYTAKQAVAAASEALEAFGGQGYMEDTGIPRLLRDAQVLPIWEGTTNVLALDALRTLSKPGVAEALTAELERLGQRPDLPAADEPNARRLAFKIGESWIRGLLEEAGARGPREARVAEIAASSAAEPADYDLVMGSSDV